MPLEAVLAFGQTQPGRASLRCIGTIFFSVRLLYVPALGRHRFFFGRSSLAGGPDAGIDYSPIATVSCRRCHGEVSNRAGKGVETEEREEGK